MIAHDIHPLRLRRTLPNAGHLLDLEKKAAGREGGGVDAALLNELVTGIGRIMASGSAEEVDPWLLAQSAREEALRLSKVAQWVRSGSVLYATPATKLAGSETVETMQIGEIELPAPCLYIAFTDILQSHDADLGVEGVYLGEGGQAEAVAEGWTQVIWALPIISSASGQRLGSADHSPRLTIRLHDPMRLVADEVASSLERRIRSFDAPSDASDWARFSRDRAARFTGEWTKLLTSAVGIALQAASLASASGSEWKRKPRPKAVKVDVVEKDKVFPAPVRIRVAECSTRRDIASFLLGDIPPRIAHRWPNNADEIPSTEEKEQLPVAAAAVDRRQPIERKHQGPYKRGPYWKVYRRGRHDEYSVLIEEHWVNGEPEAPDIVVMKHLEPRPSR